jgi:O-acetylhomoserine/O-acetylserine sulfhydrylase-like pyridoxal-dependent enzyme
MFAVCSVEGAEAAIDETTKLLYYETLANPSFTGQV